MSATGAALRAAERHESERSLPQLALQVALVLLSLLAVGYLAQMLRPTLDRPVRQVKVSGRLSHLTPTQIAAAAAIVPGTHLLAVNLSSVKAKVEALPWVAHAQVTRDWPDTLTVQVVERQPFARWDEHGLLDTEGRSFTPASTDRSASQWHALPQLAGPPGQQQDVMQIWKQFSTGLAGTPFALARLSQDARGDWRAQTRSGVTLRLGPDDPTTKLNLLRNTIPQALAGKLDQVAAIDLRYTNGFAVRWLSQDRAQHCAAPADAARGGTRPDCAADADTKSASIHPPATARVGEKPKS